MFYCPNCGSTDILVYEETAFDLNTGRLFCHSVKAHDGDARTNCKTCWWAGELRELLNEDEFKQRVIL